MKARARAAGRKSACDSCGFRYCHCEAPEVEDDEGITTEDIKAIFDDCAAELSILTEAQVKALIEACIDLLPEILSESHIKLLIQNCVDANAVTPRTDQEIKDIAQTCVRTDTEICGLIVEKLCENPKAFLTEGTVKPIIDQCISEIVIPDGVSDSHIKVVALQCFLDQEQWIKDLVQSCLPDPVEINVKAEVLQCLIDQNLTESGIKLIFEQCIDGLIPTTDDIKTIFEDCLNDWEITPECIKEYIRDHVAAYICKLLPEPVSIADVKCLIKDCYGDQLHTKADILACVNEALISAPKPRTDEEIKGLIDECVTDDRIKIQILECLQGLDGDLWTESQIIGLIQLYVKTDAQIKTIAQSCVDNAGIVSLATIEALAGSIAKTVALQCIQDNPTQIPDILDEDDVKAIFVDCLKDLVPTGGVSDGNTKAIDVDVSCDANGVITIDVVNDDGSVASGTGDLSKFFDNITPAPNTICFSFDNSTVYEANSQGKFTLDLDYKVRNWNSDTFKHVSYDPTLGCFDIPYCGPNKADINDCILTALANWDAGSGTDGITAAQAKQIAEGCIALIPEPDTHCLTGASVNVVGSAVTVTLTQENCAPVDFTFNVGADGSVECCNTGLSVTQNGDDYTVTIQQSNGPDVSGSFTVTHPAQDSYCLTSGTQTLNGQQLTTTLNQENCTPITFSSTLPTYCMTGIAQTQVGQVVTLEFAQDNCPAQQVSFTVGDAGNGSVECCNTSAVLTAAINGDAKTIDFSTTINQSVGAAVTDTASISIEDLLNVALDINTQTDTDGCSQYQQMFLCGIPFGDRIPVYEPKQPCCKSFCAEDLTGQLEITSEFEVQVTWEEGQSSVIPAGQTGVYNYAQAYTGPVLICFTDPCLEDMETLNSQISMTPKLSCC